MSEKVIQTQVINYLRMRGVLFQTSFTGLKAKSHGQINFMKSQGMKKGIPDIFISELAFDKSLDIFYGGLFLELKTTKGRLSLEQKLYRKILNEKSQSTIYENKIRIDLRYKVATAYGYDEAIKIIDDYLSMIKI